MYKNNFILCISYKLDEEIHQCRNYGGKCEDHEDCRHKNLNIGGGTYIWNNFRREIIKNLIELVHYVNELDKEYDNTFCFNLKSYKIKLKIEMVK